MRLHTSPETVTFGVMARAPVPGRCKTRLAGAIGARPAADLYEAMLRDTLDLLEGVGPDRLVVLAAPEDDGVRVLRALAPPRWEIVEQRGDGLGERLKHALAVLSPSDDDLVCLVDSDSPTIPAENFGVLREPRGPNTVILGPCDDGGYYLIGMRTPELGVFDGIPWSTPEVLARTRQRCEALGLDVHELAAGYDVDELDDLVRLRADLAQRPGIARRTAIALGAIPSSSRGTIS